MKVHGPPRFLIHCVNSFSLNWQSDQFCESYSLGLSYQHARSVCIKLETIEPYNCQKWKESHVWVVPSLCLSSSIGIEAFDTGYRNIFCSRVKGFYIASLRGEAFWNSAMSSNFETNVIISWWWEFVQALTLTLPVRDPTFTASRIFVHGFCS